MLRIKYLHFYISQIVITLDIFGPSKNLCFIGSHSFGVSTRLRQEHNNYFIKFKGATSRYFAPVFAPNKTIVKLKETKKYTHGKIEKY